MTIGGSASNAHLIAFPRPTALVDARKLAFTGIAGVMAFAATAVATLDAAASNSGSTVLQFGSLKFSTFHLVLLGVSLSALLVLVLQITLEAKAALREREAIVILRAVGIERRELIAWQDRSGIRGNLTLLLESRDSLREVASFPLRLGQILAHTSSPQLELRAHIRFALRAHELAACWLRFEPEASDWEAKSSLLYDRDDLSELLNESLVNGGADDSGLGEVLLYTPSLADRVPEFLSRFSDPDAVLKVEIDSTVARLAAPSLLRLLGCLHVSISGLEGFTALAPFLVTDDWALLAEQRRSGPRRTELLHYSASIRLSRVISSLSEAESKRLNEIIDEIRELGCDQSGARAVSLPASEPTRQSDRPLPDDGAR